MYNYCCCRVIGDQIILILGFEIAFCFGSAAAAVHTMWTDFRSSSIILRTYFVTGKCIFVEAK